MVYTPRTALLQPVATSGLHGEKRNLSIWPVITFAGFLSAHLSYMPVCSVILWFRLACSALSLRGKRTALLSNTLLTVKLLTLAVHTRRQAQLHIHKYSFSPANPHLINPSSLSSNIPFCWSHCRRVCMCIVAAVCVCVWRGLPQMSRFIICLIYSLFNSIQIHTEPT